MISTIKHIIISLIFLIPSLTYSALDYNIRIKRIHKSVLNLNFQQTDSLIRREAIIHPQNSYISYFKTYQFFLKTYFFATTSNYDKFFNSSNQCLELLENEKDQETAQILSATICVQQAFIFFLWGEHMSYVRSLMQGQSHLDEISIQCTNPEYYKIRSIYEVLGSSIPNKYKIFASWFNIKGSAQKGLELIEQYLNQKTKPSARKTEGEIINLYLKHFLDLESPEINNNTALLLIYVYLQTSSEKATEKIKRIDNIGNKKPIYLKYLKAKYLIELQDYKGVELMNQFIRENKGESYRHSAHYYLAWHFCSLGKTTAFQNEINKIKLLPSPLFPADKKALERTTQNCNSILVKSRMLFDAGEYLKAMRVINVDNILDSLHSTEDKIEYLYRLARIKEKIEQYGKAKELFSKVIKIGRSDLYFTSYSAYRLGKIYIKQRNKKLALQYFNIALDLNKGEYQKSIEQKTEFAISNLE